jgi:hypothetical protein
MHFIKQCLENECNLILVVFGHSYQSLHKLLMHGDTFFLKSFPEMILHRCKVEVFIAAQLFIECLTHHSPSCSPKECHHHLVLTHDSSCFIVKYLLNFVITKVKSLGALQTCVEEANYLVLGIINIFLSHHLERLSFSIKVVFKSTVGLHQIDELVLIFVFRKTAHQNLV